MSDEKLCTHLEEIKAIAGLRAAPNIKPHTCRHFFASNMLKNGATIKEIQAALGHSSVEQTAICLHVDEDGAKAIKKYASFNPSGSVDNRSITPGRPEKVKSGRSAQSFRRRRSTAARRMPVKV